MNITANSYSELGANFLNDIGIDNISLKDYPEELRRA
jgi:hypothetical protein